MSDRQSRMTRRNDAQRMPQRRILRIRGIGSCEDLAAEVKLRDSSGYPYLRTTQDKYRMVSTILAWSSMLLIFIMLVHIWFDYQDHIQMNADSAPFTTGLVFKGILYGIPATTGMVLSMFCARKAGRR